MGKKQDWYARYPADYKMDTSRLSLAEHGAYTLMLDRYYHDGSLPSDVQHLFNICSTRDEVEERAVQTVRDRYFEVVGDRLKQKRVEHELALTRGLLDKRSKAGKASAAARSMTGKGNSTPVQHSSTNTVQDSTGHPASGLRPGEPGPPDVLSGKPDENLTSINSITTGGASAGSAHDGSGRPDGNAVDAGAGEQIPVDGAGVVPGASPNRELRAKAKEILAYLNRATGKKFHEVDANLDPIVARIREGATEVQIREVIFDRVRAWGSDEKMFEFLRPDTLFRKSKFWQYLGNISVLEPEARAPVDSGSNSGVESTSHGHGQPAERQPGEDFEDDIPF